MEVERVPEGKEVVPVEGNERVPVAVPKEVPPEEKRGELRQWKIKGSLEEVFSRLPLPSAWKMDVLKKYSCALKDLENRPEHLAILEKLFTSGFAVASCPEGAEHHLVVDYQCETSLSSLLRSKQFRFSLTYLMSAETHEKFESIGNDAVRLIDSFVIGRVEKDREQCSVCRKGFHLHQDVRYLQPCGHKYHTQCILEYQKNRKGRCETCSG